jgi:hypothetical protein
MSPFSFVGELLKNFFALVLGTDELSDGLSLNVCVRGLLQGLLTLVVVVRASELLSTNHLVLLLHIQVI